ncbi:hypothetical protein [Nocardioides ultimimeridianus]
MNAHPGSARSPHPRARKALVLLGEVALGGLLGAAITVVEDHLAADRLGAGVRRLP